MASDTATPRQSSLAPTANTPALSKSRQASAEPFSRTLDSDAAAAARARSVSVEPEALTTPKASSPVPQSSGETRAVSVEPSSSSEIPPEDTIDMETFQQILDLDEDGTREFSRGMAWAYFSQVNATFVDMDNAFEVKDLKKLSDLGHFLKGSSAALGVSKVQASCEKLQHYGQLRDEEESKDLSSEDALGKIEPLLGTVKDEYAVAVKVLKDWYLVNDPDGEEPEV